MAVVLPASGANGSGTGAGGTTGQGGSSPDTPFGGSGPGAGGHGTEAALTASGGVLALLARLIPTLIITTGGVAMAMAFLAFGRRRRDESPTAPDSVLAAAAASGMPGASGSRLVPAAAAAAAAAPAEAENLAIAVRAASVPIVAAPVDADIPRWRRQSLLEARKADPTRSAHNSAVSLTFTGRAGEAVSGLERRRIRYRLVSLLDQPDDVRGVEIGSLDEGDEVVLLERQGTYWRVLCPDGREGWIHKMVLGPAIVDAQPAPLPGEPAGAPPKGPASAAASWTSGDEGPAPGSFEDILRLYSEHRQQLGDA